MVWHSRTGTAQQMIRAAAQGAHDIASQLAATENLQIIVKEAQHTVVSDLLDADGYLFCGPENLAALSGQMKEFFDCHYYQVLNQLNGRPYALMISAGSDGNAAARQAERICTGWRLERIAPTLIINTNAQTPEAILAPKTLTAQDCNDCAEIGGLLAALLL